MTLTRTVAPFPPHDPEPLPDEPFAPVYDRRPPRLDRHEDDWLPDPRYPDARVFGPIGSGELQRRMFYDPYAAWPLRTCTPCGVHWCSGDRCWACGNHCGVLAADY